MVRKSSSGTERGREEEEQTICSSKEHSEERPGEKKE
jgi:hypothetical protein